MSNCINCDGKGALTCTTCQGSGIQPRYLDRRYSAQLRFDFFLSFKVALGDRLGFITGQNWFGFKRVKVCSGLKGSFLVLVGTDRVWV